ncbi:Uncharacterised protein g11160 [Pycnogonum litorale]
MTPAIPYMDSNISSGQSYDAANTPQQTVSAYDNDWNVNLIPSSSTYEFQEPGYGENVIDDPDYVPDLIGYCYLPRKRIRAHSKKPGNFCVQTRNL